ncbi:hypothetical protein [Polyangium sp. 15x6]|uniref:hypothetical protein n=1 Tax=Polyangium sp. 15x6 TaxID=3042687 RepID=UPI00249B7374|nr:hypothetical protein [Polyangium sp. 15x6]MDI3282540.1 hypothetical protein [Polyangium sp. 15x6]
MHAQVDLRALPPDVLLVLLAAAALLALVQTARIAWRGFWRRRTIAVRRERGAAGELRAEGLLRDLGFTILGRQVAVSYGVRVDGDPVAIDLRADYLVGFGDKRYVAEVKTGRAAPRIDTPGTRRQLLEYRIAFDVDGVLLVDAETERVHAVEFPLGESESPRPSRLAWLLAGAAIGAVAAATVRFAL